MIVLFAAIFGWTAGVAGAHSGDLVCSHQEWTAQHMQETLGWSLEYGRQVAKSGCRVKVEDLPIYAQ